MQVLKKDINNLAELKRRKLELKARLALEKAEIIETVHLLREDMKPANLIKNAIGSFLGTDDKKEPESEAGVAGVGGKIVGALRMPLSILTDVLIPNRPLNVLLKNLVPFALDMAPKLVEKAGDAMPGRTEIFGSLRKGVSGLRKKLRKKSMKKDEHTFESDHHLFL